MGKRQPASEEMVEEMKAMKRREAELLAKIEEGLLQTYIQDSCAGSTIISTTYVSNNHTTSMNVQLHMYILSYVCCFKSNYEM